MPLDAMGGSQDLSDFRVGSPAEIVALLRECSQLLAPLRDAWAAIKPQRMAA